MMTIDSRGKERTSLHYYAIYRETMACQMFSSRNICEPNTPIINENYEYTARLSATYVQIYCSTSECYAFYSQEINIKSGGVFTLTSPLL